MRSILYFILVFMRHLSEVVSNEQGASCNARDYGATGSGLVYDTQFLQLAIDTCAGSMVVVPAPGVYLTGTLFLPSHTFLHIESGASLLASPIQDHYPASRSLWYLILAQNASDVSITGGGTIDGQGFKFVTEFDSRKNVMVSWNTTGACYGDECRPRLVGFLDCENVKVWNIRLQQPAYWCLHIVRSNVVSIYNVSIYGDFNTPNNDGIDIDSSNNTVIWSCHIDTGDDAICPKTTYGPLFNLTVSGCWIRTKSCAVKLGSATYYNFHNLSFDSIDIVDSHRGLGIQLRDSGNVSDIVFSNFNISTRYYDPSWWGRAEPIYVTSCPRTATTVSGSIANVNFVNISAFSENGIFLSGSGLSPVSGIKLKNVLVQLQRVTNYSAGLIDYRPGCQGLVEHPNSAVFIQHVSELSLEDVSISLAPSIEPSIVPVDFASPLFGEAIYFVNFSMTESSPQLMTLA